MKRILIIVVLNLIIAKSFAADSTYLQYKGVYLFPYGSMIPSVEIGISDSVLTISSNIGNSRLDKMATDTFYLVAYDGVVIFKRDNTNKVIGIKIEAQAVLLDGDKQADKSSGTKTLFKKDDLVLTDKFYFKILG